ESPPQRGALAHGPSREKGPTPNKTAPLDNTAPAPTRPRGIAPKSHDPYNKSWFAQKKPGWLADDAPSRYTGGYQAPPLDGVWATAPYFHNGSVPTLYHVLNSKARPKFFTRSYRSDKDDYDEERVGWKGRVLEKGADPKLPAAEQRKVYDTTLPGRGNGGHTYGDDLTDDERRAVIEYLKTL